MRTTLAAIYLCFLCSTVVAQASDSGIGSTWGKPIRLIFDTDMGNDVDDAVALAVIHALQGRGACELLAVTITKDNDLAAPFTDAINTFYGRGEIPIGVVRNGSTPGIGRYLGLVQELDDDGGLVFPHDLISGQDAPDAVGILRNILAKQPDESVVMIQVGFSTNLAQLLGSSPDDVSELSGRELVAKKVRLLSIMAGVFPSNDRRKSDFNIRHDIPAARRVAEDWPTEIIYSGMEVGFVVPYPVESIERDYTYAERHLLPEAYRLFDQPPRGIGPDFPMWDVTSVIYAVYPDRGYFDHSRPGKVTIDERGFTRFDEQSGGPHKYLTVNSEQAIRFQKAMVQLATQPPL